jgi:hypothetical protein
MRLLFEDASRQPGINFPGIQSLQGLSWSLSTESAPLFKLVPASLRQDQPATLCSGLLDLELSSLVHGPDGDQFWYL